MNSPKWLDRILYPFAHHTLQLPAGRMHYLDEGQGDAIVFVHGTPTWSFLWRQQIKSLSRNFRCIAPDHLGFGLSDKPAEHTFAYTPEAHANNLEALLAHLQVKNITLVVHDFGGPIGLRYALRYPENVKNLVILNTWMWSLEHEKRMMKISEFMAGRIGRFLYLQLGFSATILLPQGYHERKHLTRDIKAHYQRPLTANKTGTWKFAVALQDANPYFAELWNQRQNLRTINKLILWGEKDKLLPLHFLGKWEQEFPNAKVIKYKAGHFVQEERGGEVAEAIQQFILAN
ncbi:alpha/beta fold hydrolase [Pontibacter fetidus]|uniref:Alpha/beta fold hydrolase n=1 Tax=Pontibacter fetidus TaxID=2700082 RepID=A0A6B2GWL4_9BACT|nr:alpha/beta fold hydrolase [Pontibacter fetidus]NDK54371.1 alpha/beta fold hydrolase [Pontibacter fetidus]